MESKRVMRIIAAFLGAFSMAPKVSASDATGLQPGAYVWKVKQVADRNGTPSREKEKLTILLILSESGRYALVRDLRIFDQSHATLNQGTYTRRGAEILLNPPDYASCDRQDEAKAWKGGVTITSKMIVEESLSWHLRSEKFSYLFPVDELVFGAVDYDVVSWMLTTTIDQMRVEPACLAPRMSKVVASSYRDSKDDLSGCGWIPVP